MGADRPRMQAVLFLCFLRSDDSTMGGNVMTAANLLESLGAMLLSGGIEVVDCTGVLGPDTPLLKLPPDFAKDTPKIEIHRISEYDQDGPFWAWNWLKLGEHSGTHFDAPHHWITGKDYADGYTDTIPMQKLVANASRGSSPRTWGTQ